MSFQALAWAVEATPGSAADKLILLGLADRHNTERDAAYPSTAWLVEFSGLDRKTVIAALDRLEAAGLIADTGCRVGKTKQIKVYRLLMESLPKTEASQKRNRSVFPIKGSQKRDREPISEPVPSTAKAVSGARAKAKTSLEDAFPSSKQMIVFGTLCVQWATGELKWSAADARHEFNRFVDSNIANGRRYVNWERAWHNWCRSSYCDTAKKYEDAAAYRKGPIRG